MRKCPACYRHPLRVAGITAQSKKQCDLVFAGLGLSCSAAKEVFQAKEAVQVPRERLEINVFVGGVRWWLGFPVPLLPLSIPGSLCGPGDIYLRRACHLVRSILLAIFGS